MSSGDWDDAASATLDVRTERGAAESEWIVTISGEVDVATSPELRRELGGLIENGARSLVLDLQGTTFIDSSGLGVLVGALRRLREDHEGHIALRGMQPPVRRVFDITGLTSLFSVQH